MAKFKKRVYRKRRSKRSIPAKRVGKPIYMSGKIAGPFPQSFSTNMLYTNEQLITLISSTTAPDLHVINLTGMYDIDYTHAGHQPRGFDQLMPFFDHYSVMRCTGRVTFTNNSATAPVICWICAMDDVTEGVKREDYLENGHCNYITLGGTNGGNNIREIPFDMDTCQFLGLKRNSDSSKLEGGVASNPSENIYLHMGAICTDAFTASNVTVVYQLNLSFKFTEPKQVTSS